MIVRESLSMSSKFISQWQLFDRAVTKTPSTLWLGYGG
jgi:hypothetical protein